MQATSKSNPSSHAATGSTSHSRIRVQTPPPRPVTPLRPPSRSSLRSSHTPTRNSLSTATNSVAGLEPALAELSDSMADLEANFMHLQLMHESLSRFSECFASFLYGMNVNAFCVDFPEAPVPESFNLSVNRSMSLHNSTVSKHQSSPIDGTIDADQTFLTTDTSFVENPPTFSTKSYASTSSARANRNATTSNNHISRTIEASNPARGAIGRRSRVSGLARATNRGKSRITR